MNFFFWLKICAHKFQEYIVINTNILTKATWNTLIGIIVHSMHPPLETIKISHYSKEVIVSPFKRIDIGTESLSNGQNLNKIYFQNNYTNQILHTISKQLGIIEQNL